MTYDITITIFIRRTWDLEGHLRDPDDFSITHNENIGIFHVFFLITGTLVEAVFF